LADIRLSRTFFGGFSAATTNLADIANFRWLGGLICTLEETVFVPSENFPYHVTFDLELDLEHTLDVGSPVDHRVQVWSQSSHLPARKSDFKSSTKLPLARDL